MASSKIKTYKIEVTLPTVTFSGPGKMSKKQVKEELKSLVMSEAGLFIKQCKIKNLKTVGESNGSK